VALVVERLLLSPSHSFFGHHGGPAGAALIVEVDALECVAGRGLRVRILSDGVLHRNATGAIAPMASAAL
jgi:hypothetical protein